MVNNSLSFYPSNNRELLHIGIIPDGCRRWAKNNNFSYFEGYKIATDHLFKIVQACFEERVGILSIYGISYENFKRDDSTIKAFCNAYQDLINLNLCDYCKDKNIDLYIIGNEKILPKGLKKIKKNLDGIKKKIENKKIYFLTGYNPLQEIFACFSKIDNINNFTQNLWVKEPLDFVIRTGGANLLSNFLPIQSAYARLYFFQENFPDLEISKILGVIKEYKGLERKYGE